MRRRTFCRTTLAAGIAAALPGCGYESNESSASSTIAALTSSGAEINIETSAVSELAGELAGRLLLPADDGYN